MATDILFPLYDVLVNNIFGSVGLAIAGLAVIIILILAICRTGWSFTVLWIIFYFMVMSSLYVGALGMVLSFILISIYTLYSLLKLATGTK